MVEKYLYPIRKETQEIEKVWSLQERLKDEDWKAGVERFTYFNGVRTFAYPYIIPTALFEDTYFVNSKGELMQSRYGINLGTEKSEEVFCGRYKSPIELIKDIKAYCDPKLREHIFTKKIPTEILDRVKKFLNPFLVSIPLGAGIIALNGSAPGLTFDYAFNPNSFNDGAGIGIMIAPLMHYLVKRVLKTKNERIAREKYRRYFKDGILTFPKQELEHLMD